MKYEGLNAPRYDLEPQTIVMELNGMRHVMWLNGILPLPVGTEIELTELNPLVHATAVVKRVRLLAPTDTVGPQVCLDYEVPAVWWEAHPLD